MRRRRVASIKRDLPVLGADQLYNTWRDGTVLDGLGAYAGLYDDIHSGGDAEIFHLLPSGGMTAITGDPSEVGPFPLVLLPLADASATARFVSASNQYLSASHDVYLSRYANTGEAQSWTIWVKFASLPAFGTEMVIFSKGDTSNPEFELSYINGRFKFTACVTPYRFDAVSGLIAPQTGVWYFVACVKQAGAVEGQCYANLNRFTASTPSNATVTPGGDFFIGRRYGATPAYFNGWIYQPTRWARAINQQERDALFRNPLRAIVSAGTELRPASGFTEGTDFYLGPDVAPDVAPSAMVKTTSSLGVLIEWLSNAPNALGFQLEYSADEGATWTFLADVPFPTTQYLDFNDDGTRLHRIRAVNLAGATDWLTESSSSYSAERVIGTEGDAAITTEGDAQIEIG